MKNNEILMVQINSSGVDSGEIGYTINHSVLHRLFNDRPAQSAANYYRDIKHQLDLLNEKVDEYYVDSRTP
jgi:hypothetical protein